MAFYNGNTLNRIEEMKYYGNSHNPSQVIYKKRAGMDMVPYKEEQFEFQNNNLSKLSFFIFRDSKKINTGMIKYLYSDNKHNIIEYHSLNEGLNKMFIFGLDQYIYRDDTLITRRLIEYDINPENNQPMQIGHFVISYRDEKIESMKLTIMDKDTKKIIEKYVKESDLVLKKIEDIEDYYIQRSKGKEFIKK